MEVKLINQPDIRQAFVAMRTCYSDKGPLVLWDETNDSTINTKLLKKVIDTHESIGEHINLTFAISGISRACSHQLVRHRHCSFSQKSQRYVTEKDNFDYVMPDSIKNAPDTSAVKLRYESLMEMIADFYLDVVNLDNIPAEDARYILPNACTTDVVVTMNLREFIHICNLRLCNKAQSEIRLMTELMVEEVLTVEDMQLFKSLFVPNCLKHGKCKELTSCTKPIYGASR